MALTWKATIFCGILPLHTREWHNAKCSLYMCLMGRNWGNMQFLSWQVTLVSGRELPLTTYPTGQVPSNINVGLNCLQCFFGPEGSEAMLVTFFWNLCISLFIIHPLSQFHLTELLFLTLVCTCVQEKNLTTSNKVMDNFHFQNCVLKESRSEKIKCKAKCCFRNTAS